MHVLRWGRGVLKTNLLIIWNRYFYCGTPISKTHLSHFRNLIWKTPTPGHYLRPHPNAAKKDKREFFICDLKLIFARENASKSFAHFSKERKDPFMVSWPYRLTHQVSRKRWALAWKEHNQIESQLEALAQIRWRFFPWRGNGIDVFDKAGKSSKIRRLYFRVSGG